MQVPRNLDVRLLHFRRDLFEDEAEQRGFERRFGRPLRVPETWTDLVDVADFFTRDGVHGFLFPGRDSGLFGTFYEMLVGAGGDLFDASAAGPPSIRGKASGPPDRSPNLHHVRRVTPRELPEWHYDEISAAFRDGRAAMVCDWPGSYHLYRDPATCRVADAVGPGAAARGAGGHSRRLCGMPLVRDSREREQSRGRHRLAAALHILRRAARRSANGRDPVHAERAVEDSGRKRPRTPTTRAAGSCWPTPSAR